MNILITIISAIVAILIIILIHELGHFIVAKSLGVKVLKFSIGFGRPLYSWRSKSGTQYVIAILPLGGYVKMLGEHDKVTSPEEAARAYHRQPLLSRMAIVLAGPATNFLLALVLFWIVFMQGVAHIKPVVGKVVPKSIAAKSGLRVGDEIQRINGKRADSWQRVLMAIVSRVGDKNQMKITVLPKNQQRSATRVLALDRWRVAKRKPDFFKSLGFFPYQAKVPAIIGKIIPDSPAARSDLKVGDHILAVDDEPTANWNDVLSAIYNVPDEWVAIQIKRNGKTTAVKLQTTSRMYKGRLIGYVGIQSVPPRWPKGMAVKKHYSWLSAWVPAIVQVASLSKFNVVVLWRMLTGRISVHMLGGPITIVRSAGAASRLGLMAYLNFVAFISVMIGFINILPIPGLDGGHFLFQVLEAVFRRPVPERIQMGALWIGLGILLLLMVQATLNDIFRLF